MRILYLATADARGHLMRAQLLTHALRAAGASVDVVTTSDDGVRFLAGFGIDATLLSRHYAVQFDQRQNMLRGATDAHIAGYMFHPGRMARDMLRLRRLMIDADLVINDSFHPALLLMGCLPPWRRKVVHVYGASLRQALLDNFAGRWPHWLSRLFSAAVAFQIDRAGARLEHDFSYAPAGAGTPGRNDNNNYRLPTPVALLAPAASATSATPHAAVYLNPHFSDPALAAAIEDALARAGLRASLVGEGYAQRAGWRARDPDWVGDAARSRLIVSAPGMAALSVALVYRRPILLLVTDQPEQQTNARRAAELGLPHRTVTWGGDGAAFALAFDDACHALLAEAPAPALEDGHAAANQRLRIWVEVLTTLAPLPPDATTASNALPTHLTRIEPWRAITALALDWTLIAACFAAAIHFPTAPVYLAAAVLIARSQLALAVLMHESAHRVLLTNRVLNDWVGQLLTAAPLMLSMFSYRRGHLRHHRAPMAPDDPVASVFGIADYPVSRKELAWRLLQAVTGVAYVRTMLAIARGKHPDPDGPPPRRPARQALVVASMLGMTALMWGTLAALGHGWLYLGLWSLPSLTLLQLFARMRAITEHAGYGATADQASNARSVVRPNWQTFFCGPHAIHYHIEHHLHVRAPFYHLGAIHRLLRRQGRLPPDNLVENYWQVLKQVSR